jgi:putative ABC transport system permease protein
MNFILEIFVLGLTNLRLHLLRTILTALGIILGVAAVIIMVSLGEGSKEQALEQIAKLGAQNIIVRSQRPPEDPNQQSSGGGRRTSWLNRYGITRADEEVIRDNFPDATIVPLKEVGSQIIRDSVRKTSQAYGTTPELLEAAKLRVARGRYLSQADLDQTSAVCVLGAELAKQFFRLEDPLGGTIRIDDKVFTVVGILGPVGIAGGAGAALVGRDLDLDMQIPISTARVVFGDMVFRRSSGNFQNSSVEIAELYVVAPSVDRVMTDAARLQRIIDVRHDKLRDVSIKVPYELLENAERTARMFKITFGAVAGIALLVGGIGIMNIMLATVTERTREIGIRRALGATRRHVILQFLVETSVISSIGGMIGIGAGVGFSWLVDWAVPKLPSLPWVGDLFPADASLPASVTVGSIILAFSVAFVTGLIFGIYPARRAAAQDPIVALRHT